jgi:hypothetical protein
MATYNSGDLAKSVRSSALANGQVYSGTLTPSASVVTGDILKFCVIPAGTNVHRITVVNASLGTTVPGDLEFAPTDGSTKTAFSTAFAFQTANANGSAVVKAPVLLAKDSWLQVTLGTVSAGGAAAVTLIAEGEGIGQK